MIQRVPQMPLMLQENYTLKLLELLKQGEIDAAIMALPFPETGLMVRPLYDEPFVVALPAGHPWEKREEIDAEDLKQETMLLLGNGHCFRDHVLGVCPELMRFSQTADGIQKTFEAVARDDPPHGRKRCRHHRVAADVGRRGRPRANGPDAELLSYVPFNEPVPDRRVVLVWRKSFTRMPAIDAISDAISACELPGVAKLDMPATMN